MAAKATQASAMSSAVATRRSGAERGDGLVDGPQSAVHGVATRPGATELTRTPPPACLAMMALRWSTAALDTA